MTSEKIFDIGGMHIEIFLPGQEINEKIIIPEFAHGSNIVTIQSGDENVDGCDALITQNRNVTLGVRTADCAAICLSDEKSIGIAHIGWRGLCQGLIEKMLAHFDVAKLPVYVAPFLHSFEIQKDFCYEAVVDKFGEQCIERHSGRLIFNFKEVITSILPSQTVYDIRDVMTDISFPSNRRDGTKDRFTTAISFAL